MFVVCCHSCDTVGCSELISDLVQHHCKIGCFSCIDKILLNESPNVTHSYIYIYIYMRYNDEF